ncbi:hypothetical protein HAX54_006361, partial [Datura stramonium]|nr:hypothetical protein [Datura stramonium]
DVMEAYTRHITVGMTELRLILGKKIELSYKPQMGAAQISSKNIICRGQGEGNTATYLTGGLVTTTVCLIICSFLKFAEEGELGKIMAGRLRCPGTRCDGL